MCHKKEVLLSSSYGKGKGKVGNPNSNPKKAVLDITSVNDPKEAICYYYQEKGH